MPLRRGDIWFRLLFFERIPLNLQDNEKATPQDRMASRLPRLGISTSSFPLPAPAALGSHQPKPHVSEKHDEQAKETWEELHLPKVRRRDLTHDRNRKITQHDLLEWRKSIFCIELGRGRGQRCIPRPPPAIVAQGKREQPASNHFGP